MTAPVPSLYPADAVEITVTILVDMTGEAPDSNKHQRVIDAAMDAAESAGALAVWTTSDYVRNIVGEWRELRYKRPPEFVRPRTPRRKL